MKVKICGITNIEDAKLCAELGADAIGFIFYKKSKRYIEPQIVKKIVEQLPPFIIKVGVFVDEETDVVNLVAKDVGLSMVQLHGNESIEDTENINYPVIKAFRVKEDFDFGILNKYKNCSFLLDAYDEKEYGGTGQSFQWNKIPDKLKNKIILAGGVSENNIKIIYNEVNPYAIDISSSVEISPGKKDHEKLNRLFTKLNEVRK